MSDNSIIMTAIGLLPGQGAVIKAQNYKKISDSLYQIMIKTLVGPIFVVNTRSQFVNMVFGRFSGCDLMRDVSKGPKSATVNLDIPY